MESELDGFLQSMEPPDMSWLDTIELEIPAMDLPPVELPQLDLDEVLAAVSCLEKTKKTGRGMQKRNFDSELKSLNDKPSNQASICKATSSPKLNGVF